MHPPDLERPHAGDTVDGYRLLRKLGEGRRAGVFLGLADGEPHAALKVYRSSCGVAERATELEALTRSAHAHVVHVRDVGSDSLILERLELGSLTQLLVSRSTLSLGEVLTVLAPLGSALDAMHASGVAHGSLAPGAILFRATGAPVIAGFGRATLHEPSLTPAALAGIPGVLADRSAFGRIAITLLAAVDDDRCARALDWLASQQAQSYPDDVGEALGERLFEVADAEPVRFERDETPAAPVVPARALPIARRTGMPEWIDEVVSESLDGSPIALLRARVLPHLRGVRRPVWVVAGAVGAALVLALVVVPSNDSQEPVVTEPAPTETPVVMEQSVVTGDDPVAAVASLLELRRRCILDLSVLCLDGVDQIGSAAMAADVALVRSLQSDAGEQAPDALPDVTAATLVERLGDSALLRLTLPAADDDAGETQPASLLLMKGEAGWRIRSYLIDD